MGTIFFENWRNFQGFKMKFEIQFQFSSRLKISSFKIRVNKTVTYEDEAFWILGFLVIMAVGWNGKTWNIITYIWVRCASYLKILLALPI